jgi:hypothetical protein
MDIEQYRVMLFKVANLNDGLDSRGLNLGTYNAQFYVPKFAVNNVVEYQKKILAIEGYNVTPDFMIKHINEIVPNEVRPRELYDKDITPFFSLTKVYLPINTGLQQYPPMCLN